MQLQLQWRRNSPVSATSEPLCWRRWKAPDPTLQLTHCTATSCISHHIIWKQSTPLQLKLLRWYLYYWSICNWGHPGHLLPWFTFQLVLLTNYTSFICFFYSISFSLCAFYFALCALCNKRHLTWVPGVALCQLWNILAAAAAILAYFTWLERPNSSNSLPPTTGKFGRNSLLRTIFKFLRLLSSAGRNTQWWPQHQPLVSREFCFSQIALKIY